MYMKKMKFRRALCLVLALLTLCLPAQAAFTVEGIGDIVRQSILPLGPGTYFNTATLKNTVSGTQEERYIEYTPGGDISPMIAYGSKLYGKSTATEVAAYVSSLGKTPVAAVNGDFFMLDTGIPIGLVMTDGIIRSSDAGANALCFTSDGSAFISKPALSVKLSVGGKQVAIEYINKTRKYYGLYLFTPDFSATTRVAAQGTDIVISNIQGELTVGGTITGTVEKVVTGAGALPLEAGKLIISGESSHGQAARLDGITAGMPVTLTVTSPDPYLSDAVCTVGAGDRLLTDGVIASGLASGTAPRTAIGIKPDGTCVFYTVDGRQSGYSQGMSLSSVAARLLSLGCTQAVNLDGGGSTAMTANYPGDSALSLTNKPSDGSLRKCANYLFLINNAAPTGELGGLYVYPYDIRILKGASQQMDVRAADTAYYKMDVPAGLTYGLDVEALGSITQDGMFTAAATGSGYALVNAGGVDGGTSVTVYDTPSSIALVNAATGTQLSTLAPKSGEIIKLRVQGYVDGLPVISENKCFTWEVIGNVGSVTPDGVFTASAAVGATGYVRVRCGSFSMDYKVTVDTAPAVLTGFEGTGSIASAAGIEFTDQSDMAYVRFGKGSGRLTYSFDLAQTEGQTAEITALSAPMSISMSGNPAYLGAWVYGDGSMNILYLSVTAGGATQHIKLGTLDYTGYRYLSAALPAGATAFGGFILQRQENGSSSGTIYIDQVISSHQSTLDQTAPEITIDEESSTVQNGVLSLYATVIDDTGAAPAKSHVTVTLDGIAQEFTYDTVTGKLTATIGGIDDTCAHRVTITAQDTSGNLSRASLDVVAGEEGVSPFADTAGHWAESYTNYLNKMGVLNGTQKNGAVYCYPNASLTRAQMAVLMAQYLKVDTSKYASVTMPFSDTAAIPAWAESGIKAMYSMGVLQGRMTNGKLRFDPDAKITRAEMMTVIGRTLPRGYTQKALTFADSSAIPAYAKDYVGVMTTLGVLSGYTDNTVRPASFVTRAEAAKMLSRLY